MNLRRMELDDKPKRDLKLKKIYENVIYTGMDDFLEHTKSFIELPFLGIINENKVPIPRQRVECADGFTISIQANEFTYCTPRNNEGPWTHVELGFPSDKLPIIFNEFSGDDDVYGYVPIEYVDQLIRNHGSIIRTYEEIYDESKTS